MTDELRPPPFEPLPAPEGAFESAVRRAKARRWRRATSVLGVVAVLGLAGAVLATGGNDQRVEVADDPDVTTSTTSEPTTTATTADTTVVPATATSLPAEPTTTTEFTGDGAPPDEGEVLRWYEVRVLDPDGAPLERMVVRDETSGQVSSTGDDGVFFVECDSVQFLMVWGVDLLGVPRLASANDRWAPLWIGPGGSIPLPPCQSAEEPAVDVHVELGWTMTGIISNGDGVMANIDHLTTMVAELPGFNAAYQIISTDDTGRYWLHGMPSGDVRLTNFGLTFLHVSGSSGEVVAVDWRPDPDQLPEQYQNNETARNAPLPTVPGTPPP